MGNTKPDLAHELFLNTASAFYSTKLHNIIPEDQISPHVTYDIVVKVCSSYPYRFSISDGKTGANSLSFDIFV